ncbi:xyloglucan O-acetyltransferase 4-like [Typha latifolia]|uniref:xyloglucan O-acetyltransferase 4-like n=1 Tax=Typha latifolia TaxID=4733 RepID=UPI003C2C073F
MAKEMATSPLSHQQKHWKLVSRKSGPLLLFLLMASFIVLLSVNYPPNTSREELTQSLLFEKATNVDCDLFNGTWVRDFGKLAYSNRTCKTLPDSKNCGKYGKDQDFVNWRWKPYGCELPRFNPEAFLNVVRGKTLAFVGDSVARNQMDSLLCLLSQVEAPMQLYKDAEDRFTTWYFGFYDFTMIKLWTKFLVEGRERQINQSATEIYDLHLDRIDTSWADKLQQTSYVVISAGHWFFRKNYLYEGGKIIGCIFCSETSVKDLGVSFAIKKAFRTALHFLSECKECDGRLTLVRTFSPAHFENGPWNGGGYCNRTIPLNEAEVSLSGSYWEIRNAQVAEAERLQGEQSGANQVGLVDVTKAMMMRPDAHPGTHWNNEWMRGYSDCVHWCLPGAIDMWNDLLLAKLIQYGSNS